MSRIDKFVFVTESNKDRFDLLFPGYSSRSGVCENIIDAESIVSKSQMIPDDECYSFFAGFTGLKIITVCRLTENIKGIDRIVRFAKMLKTNGTKFRWCILGDGKDRSSIKKQIVLPDSFAAFPSATRRSVISDGRSPVPMYSTIPSVSTPALNVPSCGL